jgi:hypothetical protein
MRRVRPPEYVGDARLDDLLRYDEPGPAPAAPPRGGVASWLPRLGLNAFLGSAVTYMMFHVFGLAPPYVLLIGVWVGFLLVRRSVSLTAEPGWRRTSTIIRPLRRARRIDHENWYAGGDGMLDAIQRWHRRLEWGVTAPERFDHTVRVPLGEIVDERLRQRHGFTRTSDPARARAVLGEPAWTLLNGPLNHVPRPREVAELVQRMETL